MLTVRVWGAAALLALTAACSGSDGTAATRTPSPTPSPTPASATPTVTPPPLRLVKLNTFASPVWAGPVPGDPLHLWVVEKVGRIVEITTTGEKVRTILDMTRIVSRGNEQGLLSLAFDPKFPTNQRFYVNYTDAGGDTQVVRYTLVDAEPRERTVLLTVDQPYANHNGGLILFDSTGKLLVGMGDGGSAGDPENRAQDLTSDLGKILRIEPEDGAPAADNPYKKNPKVWALGLRNPWRFSFDTNGDLYVGDVGQNKVEEIDRVPPDLQRGANYGWAVYEGSERFKDDEDFTDGGPLITPALTYLHSEGGCSVTGGLVYRGTKIPRLVGHYVFGDYCAGKLLESPRTARGLGPSVPLGLRVEGLQAFGVDHDNELLVMSADTLFALAP